MKNLLMTIEYDGSGFHGWQEQPGLRTVQGELQEALLKVTGSPISVNGTSRTDAGVHALGQCCSFNLEPDIPLDNFKRALNNSLSFGKTISGSIPGDIRVLDIKKMPEEFHARFDCRGKTYRYVLNTGAPDAFRGKYCYYTKEWAHADGNRVDSANANREDLTVNEGSALDLDTMREAAKIICGTHDFACFQAAGGTPRETTVRTIFDLRIRTADGEFSESDLNADPSTPLVNGMDITNLPNHNWLPGDVVIEITGDGFLYNMVRIIVGTLVEVGQGRRTVESVKYAIESCDRTKAGHTAPPNGLYLGRIYF